MLILEKDKKGKTNQTNTNKGVRKRQREFKTQIFEVSSKKKTFGSAPDLVKASIIIKQTILFYVECTLTRYIKFVYKTDSHSCTCKSVPKA